MTPRSRTIVFIFVGLAVLALVLALGVYLGKNQGAKETTEKLSPLLDYAFPKPPDVIKSLSGKITGIYGGTVNLLVPDPNDYLPHTDNTPRATQTRFAPVTKDTKFFLIDYSKLSATGQPRIAGLKLSDLKVGDAVTVTSTENIKDAEKFDATEISLVKYP